MLLLAFGLNAQSEIPYGKSTQSNLPHWAQLLYSPNPDPGKVVAEYKAYYKTHPFVKNQHTQYYKRWLRNFSRVPYNYPKGSPEDLAQQQNRQNYLQTMQSKGGAVWQSIGPYDFDKDAESRSYAPGAAHVYTTEQSASSPNILYAGTSNAGVWKSIDKGLNWVCLTKGMMINYVFSIEIHPTNPNIVLFGGDGKIYKTSDGGTNWVLTTIGGSNPDEHDVRDIVFDPTNPSVAFFSSDKGYYRSTNGGDNWTEIYSGDFQEIELKPNDNNIVYLIQQSGNATLFRRSINNGVSFTTITNGWPVPAGGDEQKRTEIATTPSAPNNVYALCTGNANGGTGLYGIYFSSDQGQTWTFRCCGVGPGGVPAPDNINMMGWDDQGQDDGGQYYYDLAMDVSDSNPLEVHVAGVNHWVSTDGGFTFTCPSKWSEPEKVEYVHADIHDIRFYGNDLWISCDGGIFYSTTGGDTINRRMKGIEGTDFWGFGASASNNKVMLGGTYHNGTLLKDEDTYENGWLSCMGGDNIRGYVNFANDRKVYHDYGTSVLSGNRTVPLEGGSFPEQPNASYIIGQSSNYEFHPHSQNIIYYGNETKLVKSDGEGAGASTIYDFGEEVTSVEIAPSNPNVIYVCTFTDWWGDKHVWRSDNGGQSFTNITPASGTINGDIWVPYDIAVSDTDPNTVWLARTSQYEGYPSTMDGYLVFKSANGGQTWANYSTGLAGESITNIEYQRGTNGGVWVGTRRAVYYRNNASAAWQLYNSGLPASTFSTQLAINYRQGVVWNATNRSVYEAPLVELTNPPLAQIAADKFVVDCFDNVVHFADNSAMSAQGAAWQWSFPGGNPTSSTDQNPTVTYSAPGFYNVTLTVTDVNGNNSQTLNSFIKYIATADTVNLVQDFEALGFPDNRWRLLSSNTINWSLADVTQGPQCLPTKALSVQNYYIENPGDEAWLLSPPVSLAGLISPQITYYYAYANYPDYNDGFRVEISNNCGTSWQTLFEASGTALTTVNPTTDAFAPTNCSEWVQKNHDISSYIGDTVLFRFAGINAYGNNLYLDDINITGQPNALEETTVAATQVFPNPGYGDFFIRTQQKAINVTVYSATGQQVYNTQLNEGTSKISVEVASGLYLFKIEGKSTTEYLKVIVN